MQNKSEQLQSVLDIYVDGSDLPGANATLFVEGARVWEGTSGWLQADRRDALSPGSTFPTYSITKTLTAACALRMAEEGAVDLDAPLSVWLPDLHFAERVSVAQVLAHTAGIHDYGAMPEYHEAIDANPSTPWSFEEYVARTCELPLDFEPGEGWAYSNSGYTLVKRILELTTRGSFGAALYRYVLSPLGMNDTFQLVDLADMERVVPGNSTLFSKNGTVQDVRGVYHPGWCGTGVVASTGSDLCRFFDSLFNGSLLSQESLNRMLSLRRVPGEHPPSVSPSYGLGIMGDPDSPRGENYSHGGTGPGWNLYALHIPNHDGNRVSLAVLCNHDGEHAELLVDKLLKVVNSNPHSTAESFSKLEP